MDGVAWWAIVHGIAKNQTAIACIYSSIHNSTCRYTYVGEILTQFFKKHAYSRMFSAIFVTIRNRGGGRMLIDGGME